MVKDISYKQEVMRKLGHLFAGAFSLALGTALYRMYGLRSLETLLFVCLLFSFSADFLRLELGFRIPQLAFLERKRETFTLHATTFALLGSILALQFFDIRIAVASISMFFAGDAFAALVGKRFGKTKLWKSKSLQGSLAMLAVSLLAGYIVLGQFWLSLAMAVAATFVELAVEKIDDSFAIIVFAGLVGQVLG